MASNPKPILPMLLKKSHPIGPLPDGTNSCRGTGQTIINGHVKPHNTRPTALAYECIGAIMPDIDPAGIWQRAEKQSTIASYRFPPQDSKLREGTAVLHAPTLQKVGTIIALDCE